MLYTAAKLCEAGVSLEEFADLTDAQIHAIYGHPRDNKGRLIPPDRKPGRESRAEFLANLLTALQDVDMTQEQKQAIYDKEIQAWEEKHRAG